MEVLLHQMLGDKKFRYTCTHFFMYCGAYYAERAGDDIVSYIVSLRDTTRGVVGGVAVPSC